LTGPDGLVGDPDTTPWKVTAFETYEEAYAYSLGYTIADMEANPVIRRVREAYRKGRHSKPPSYYIIPAIPSIYEEYPVQPPNAILPWVQKRNADTTPMSSAPRHRPFNSIHRTPSTVRLAQNLQFRQETASTSFGLRAGSPSPAPRGQQDPKSGLLYAFATLNLEVSGAQAPTMETETAKVPSTQSQPQTHDDPQGQIRYV
jgi:hypothetical protein